MEIILYGGGAVWKKWGIKILKVRRENSYWNGKIQNLIQFRIKFILMDGLFQKGSFQNLELHKNNLL